MATSVAGQIRIDLLADVARFQAQMREAGRAVGDFQSEFERRVRGFNAPKAMAHRAAQLREAWQSALTGEGGPLHVRGGYPIDVRDAGRLVDEQLRREVRLRSMLPWGASLRTEMSREAALTAAAIAEHQRTIGLKLVEAARGINSAVGGIPLVGPALGLLNANPLLAIGGATVGAMMAQQRRENALAREVAREAKMLGQSPEEASRLHAAGMAPELSARFLRSLAESRDSDELRRAFASLRLEAKQLASLPLSQALMKVGDALREHVKNPAEKAAVAMRLFGRGGAEVIPVLERMREKIADMADWEKVTPERIARVKAFDRASADAAKAVQDALGTLNRKLGSLFGTEAGLTTHVLRGFAGFVTLLTGDADKLDKMVGRWEKLDAAIRDPKLAQDLAPLSEEDLALQEAAAKRAANAIERLTEKIEEMTLGAEKAERLKLERELSQAGLFTAQPLASPTPKSQPLTGPTPKAKAEAERELREALQHLEDLPKDAGEDARREAKERLQRALARAKRAVKAEPEREPREALPPPRILGGSPEEFRARARAAGVREIDVESYLRWRNLPGDRLLRQYDQAKEEERRRKEREDQERRDRERVEQIVQEVPSGGTAAEQAAAKYRREIAELNDLWNRGQLRRDRSRDEAERLYWATARRYLADYYREAAGLDAEQLRRELRSAADVHRERVAWLGLMRDQGMLSRETAADAAQRSLDQLRAGLGVRDPFAEYRRAFRELSEAREFLGADEFARRRRELRRQAAEEFAAQRERPTPLVAAMQAGSAEAYAAIVQAMAAGPHQAALERANAILDRIERNTRPGQQATVLTVKDF